MCDESHPGKRVGRHDAMLNITVTATDPAHHSSRYRWPLQAPVRRILERVERLHTHPGARSDRRGIWRGLGCHREHRRPVALQQVEAGGLRVWNRTHRDAGGWPHGTPGQRFPVKYYLTAMLFIVFDIEIVFLYPWQSATTH